MFFSYVSMTAGLAFCDGEAVPKAKFWLLMEAAGQMLVLLASSRARRNEDLRCIDILLNEFKCFKFSFE